MKQIKAFICLLISWCIIWAYFVPATKLLVGLLANGFIKAGIVFYAVIYYTALRHGSHFWRILDHELLHSLASILCLKSVRQLHADHQVGGHVEYRGSSNIFISLAPYIIWRLPVTFILIFVCAIQQALLLKMTLFLLGMALTYALLAIFEEAKPHQTDLIKHGLLCSYSYILAVNVLVVGLFTDLATHQHFTSSFMRSGFSNLAKLASYQ